MGRVLVRYRSVFCGLAAACLLILCLSSPSAAQEAESGDGATSVETLGGLTPQERAELFSRLSDEEARALLLDYLKWTAERETAPPSLVDQLSAQGETFRQNLVGVMKSAPQLLGLPAFVYRALSEGRSQWAPLRVLGILLVTMLGAYIVERFYLRFLSGLRERLKRDQSGDYLSKMGRVFTRFAISLSGLAVFTGAILAIFFLLYSGHEPSRLLVMSILTATVLFRAFALFFALLFWPGPDEVGLYNLPAEAGRRAYRSVLWVIGLGSYGFIFTTMIRELEFPQLATGFLNLLLGLLIFGIIIGAVWRLRQPVAQALAPSLAGDAGERGLASQLASYWHLPVILYFLVILTIGIFEGFSGGTINAKRPAFFSILLVLALPLLDLFLTTLLARVFPNQRGEDLADVFGRAVHIFVGLTGLAALAAIWQVPIFNLDATSLGGKVTRAALDIAITILLGYVIWGLVRAAIYRQMPVKPAEGEEAEEHGAEGGAANATRLGTVLPLLLKVAQITIAAMVIMVILSSLGVNIGPLLAGAGVIGLAVGFGAQTLVRDLVSGLFFLIDDAFRKGEYVDVGSAKGVVEKINMRSLVLRHHMGPLHTVPFGEIQTLSNFSRDWLIMKLEFRVGYDTDPNKVKKIFKEIGKDLLADPILGPDFLEPFKSQGVKSMEDSAMIVRGKFMAKPGKQFMIRKEIYNRVQKAFQENGIEFAHRRVTVELPEDVQLTPEQKEKVAEAGAAAIAAEEQQDGHKA
ncbi:mechanosensitive ion channel family protein [Limibacillus halophilus]